MPASMRTRRGGAFSGGELDDHVLAVAVDGAAVPASLLPELHDAALEP
jgi:hypothetical protein